MIEWLTQDVGGMPMWSAFLGFVGVGMFLGMVFGGR